MPIDILMPALSPTMTEGNLARWLKKEGDKVKAGDVIAEIETDKATMEVEAVDEGVIGKIVVAEGTEGVKVNATIAVLLEDGEDASAIGATPKVSNGASTTTPEAPAAAPATTVSIAPSSAGAARGDRVFASPLARRLAAEAGLSLDGIKGTGPHGRIVKADIEAALQAPRSVVAATPTAAAAAPEMPAPKAQAPVPAAAPIATPLGAYDEIPLNNMRKTIARRLTESKQTVPHFYLSVDIELDALLSLRGQINGQEGSGYKISVNDFVIKAVALALRKVPACNASFGGDKVYQYKDVDVAVAVAIDGGLITPIIRKADQKSLSSISAEMKDLATRAKAGKLKPEEFQGGGFSISNLGMFGVKEFAAIVNPPQACIMAVGAGEQRPVVKSGALAVATVMTVTLSTDHRIVDGALGAEFLKEFKALIERPLTMLV